MHLLPQHSKIARFVYYGIQWENEQESKHFFKALYPIHSGISRVSYLPQHRTLSIRHPLALCLMNIMNRASAFFFLISERRRNRQKSVQFSIKCYSIFYGYILWHFLYFLYCSRSKSSSYFRIAGTRNSSLPFWAIAISIFFKSDLGWAEFQASCIHERHRNMSLLHLCSSLWLRSLQNCPYLGISYDVNGELALKCDMQCMNICKSCL